MTNLLPGMQVRFPIESRPDGQHRDFRLGRVIEIDESRRQVNLEVEVIKPNEPPHLKQIHGPVTNVHRCRILAESPCTYRPTHEHGHVLVPRCNEPAGGDLLEYYIELGGHTLCVSEGDLTVPWTCQDPDPSEQILNYELHNPIWRKLRDEVIESYAELLNTTFGIEELVSSRLMLLAHQAEVIARVLADVECRYILADEVGLGKTIEACVILKALRRRDPQLEIVIVTPDSIMHQWRNELSRKFWLDFAFVAADGTLQIAPDVSTAGIIVSTEVLSSSEMVVATLIDNNCGLLIVDEAHHLLDNPILFDRIRQLSARAKRVLLLSATPIQRRADEYFALLTLLDPQRYGSLQIEEFQRMLLLQDPIRKSIAYLTPALQPDRFDVEEFREAIQTVVDALSDDPHIFKLAAEAVSTKTSSSHNLVAARELIGYISENYRIERRIIRNRRANLQITLCRRQLDASYCYNPAADEAATLIELYSYVEERFSKLGSTAANLEYGRLLLHAAASSPYALLELLSLRLRNLQSRDTGRPRMSLSKLSTPLAPRQEPERIHQLVCAVPVLPNESTLLETLIWHATTWRAQTEDALKKAVPIHSPDSSACRFVQVLRAVKNVLDSDCSAKVIIFSSWPLSLHALQLNVEKQFGMRAVALYTVSLDPDQLENAADQFQANSECRILLSDELGGEGRNFQMATAIIHLDLPWTPTQLEQRIGRVDRLGNTHLVTSISPYAAGWLEHDLFRLWQEAFQIFTQSISGMEIALEKVLDLVLEALARNVRHGLNGLLPSMVTGASKLRQQVEEERYFEEVSIDRGLRNQFRQVSDQYADGQKLRVPLLKWAELAGLEHFYDRTTDTVVFEPKRFNLKCMQNAKFLPPNMDVAVRRARNPRNLLISGTFNRTIAIQREDLVFFAPKDDPWTDAIVTNAMEADRGRSCAIRRTSTKIEANWDGFELLYSVSIDPRPLYAEKLPPTHLLRAQGALDISTIRVLTSSQGDVIPRSDPIWQVIQPEFNRGTDVHLGKRDSPGEQLDGFMRQYPSDLWNMMIERALNKAQVYLAAELAFMKSEAKRVKVRFARHADGWMASRRWLTRKELTDGDIYEIEEYRRVSALLVEGLGQPRCQLESICFWELRRSTRE